jgi:hypothetical protein
MQPLSTLAQSVLARVANTATNDTPAAPPPPAPPPATPDTPQVLRNNTAATQFLPEFHAGDLAQHYPPDLAIGPSIATLPLGAVKANVLPTTSVATAISRFGIDIIGKLGNLFPLTFQGPPILGSFQEQRFHDKLNSLPFYERPMVDFALANASNDHERQYIEKALAAGHSAFEVLTFAQQIHGKSDAWMQQNLRLTGNANGAPGLSQQWNDSCAPTAAEVMRGEMDPIYSLGVRQNNADIHAVNPNPGPLETAIDALLGKPAGNRSVANEQKQILENNGGVAVERGQSGGSGMNLLTAFNSMSQWTGVTYVRHKVTTDTDRSSALGKLDADLAAGIPGGLRISDSDTNPGGHAVAVTGSIDGPPKQYVIHDPWDGKTVYVKASDLAKGNIIPSIAGWTHMTDVYSST